MHASAAVSQSSVPWMLLLLRVLLLCCMGHCCCMCCCFACAATLVVLVAYVVAVTNVVLSVLCLHLSYAAAPAAIIVDFSAVVIACGAALRYTAAQVSTLVLGVLLLSCVPLLHVLLLSYGLGRCPWLVLSQLCCC